MQPVRRLADLPFRQRPVLELLNLLEDRAAPDPDYAGYGYARVAEVWLDGDDDDASQLVRDAVLVAVHSRDDGEARPDDVELEFILDDGSSVAAFLSRFLEVWLPQIAGDAAAIVLVMCNPHRARLPQPAAAAATPVHYAAGDVESWLLEADGGERLALQAESWHLAE